MSEHVRNPDCWFSHMKAQNFVFTDQKKKPFTHVKENSSEHKSSPIRYTGTLFSPVYHCYGSHTLEDGENNNTVLETDDSDSTASSKFLG